MLLRDITLFKQFYVGQKLSNKNFSKERLFFIMMDFFRMLNSFFYGDHWYIYWGIVAVLIIFAVAVRLPSFIKSIKEAKKRSNSK